MFFVRIYEVHYGDYKKHLNGYSIVTMIIVAYLMFIIILQNFLNFPSWARMFTFVILMVLLSSPFGIAIKIQWEELRTILQTYSIERNPLTKNPKVVPSTSYSKTGGDQMEYHELPTGEGRLEAASDDILPYEDEKNILQAMCTVEFWMLFVTMISG